MSSIRNNYLASCISCASLSPPTPRPFKPTTKLSQQRQYCFLFVIRGCHGSNQYPCLRVSTKSTRRLDHVQWMKMLDAKCKCCSSNIDNVSSEFIENSSSKDDDKNWTSRVHKISLNHIWNLATVPLFLSLNHTWKQFHHLNIVPFLDNMDHAYSNDLWTMSRQSITVAILRLCLH
ncbi:uncharacterized protein A4U43_C09F9420 [Asparagus officinalis]|uniref:Uncharacterized protein n=1 Tax=Asparagus officinalis TaxID=4686 RepID=A0A5P1E9Q5_ASPOF|nr:uncharacterized protein A4U43_C09F9420 [Asparagus officinalis]